jgi:hypothetical protein
MLFAWHWLQFAFYANSSSRGPSEGLKTLGTRLVSSCLKKTKEYNKNNHKKIDPISTKDIDSTLILRTIVCIHFNTWDWIQFKNSYQIVCIVTLFCAWDLHYVSILLYLQRPFSIAVASSLQSCFQLAMGVWFVRFLTSAFVRLELYSTKSTFLVCPRDWSTTHHQLATVMAGKRP